MQRDIMSGHCPVVIYERATKGRGYKRYMTYNTVLHTHTHVYVPSMLTKTSAHTHMVYSK